MKLHLLIFVSLLFFLMAACTREPDLSISARAIALEDMKLCRTISDKFILNECLKSVRNLNEYPQIKPLPYSFTYNGLSFEPTDIMIEKYGGTICGGITYRGFRADRSSYSDWAYASLTFCGLPQNKLYPFCIPAKSSVGSGSTCYLDNDNKSSFITIVSYKSDYLNLYQSVERAWNVRTALVASESG